MLTKLLTALAGEEIEANKGEFLFAGLIVFIAILILSI